MLDTLTLDQLRTLRIVAEEGSFSAAARKLRRVQSAVSQSMTNLERTLGVPLWDRSTKLPQLTDAGRAVLAAADRICADVGALETLSRALSGGIEARVGLVVDAIFPVPALVALCREFGAQYPAVELTVFTETMGDVTARVQSGDCQVGVAGPAAPFDGLERTHLSKVRMIPVAASSHPLAALKRPLLAEDLAAHTQIVLSERGERPTGDVAVVSPRTWRIVDLATKHALIRGGLGWGNLPEHAARDDIEGGRLIKLRLAAWSDDEHHLSLSLVHRRGAVLGPATSWLTGRMRELCLLEVGAGPRKAAVKAQRA